MRITTVHPLQECSQLRLFRAQLPPTGATFAANFATAQVTLFLSCSSTTSVNRKHILHVQGALNMSSKDYNNFYLLTHRLFTNMLYFSHTRTSSLQLFIIGYTLQGGKKTIIHNTFVPTSLKIYESSEEYIFVFSFFFSFSVLPFFYFHTSIIFSFLFLHLIRRRVHFGMC